MGTLTFIVTAGLAVILSASGGQLASEFRDWTPRLADWLIDRAVSNLPLDQRERFSEEWREFVFDAPGHTAKILRALGLLWAARAMSLDLEIRQATILSRTVGASLLLFQLPLIIMIVSASLWRGGPVLEKKNGIYRFRVGTGLLGEFLRDSSLDSLPSLWNIAKGDICLKFDRKLVEDFLSLFFRKRS